MSIRELQQSYESRIKDVRGYIYKQTRDNEDLRQEACMATWRGLMKDPVATNGYLMNRIKWRLMDVWKNGTSVDKPNKTREDITILRFDPQDFENEIYAEYLAASRLEREIVKYKLKGLVDRDIILELGITREHYRRVKRGIRSKIKEFFAV